MYTDCYRYSVNNQTNIIMKQINIDSTYIIVFIFCNM